MSPPGGNGQTPSRFAQFTPEEVTMIYTGLLEAPRVAPGWKGAEPFERLKRECGEAVDLAVQHRQMEQHGG